MRALPSVAASAASRVVSQFCHSGPCTFETNEASRSDSYMFWLSEQEAPSVPMPRLTRRSSIAAGVGEPGAQPHVAARVVRHRGALVAEPRHVVMVEPDAVRHREMRSDDAEPVEMRGLGLAV